VIECKVVVHLGNKNEPTTAMPSKTEPFGVDDEHYLGLGCVVTVALQLSCFAVAYTCEFDLITDFAGSTNFVLLAVSASIRACMMPSSLSLAVVSVLRTRAALAIARLVLI
jgi:hypothetical protein